MSKNIHSLIAKTFIFNHDNKCCINHKNGIKHDNRIENLEWVTYKENTNHAIKLGLINCKGEKSKKSKLTFDDVKLLRSIPFNDRNVKESCKKYNICNSTYQYMINNETYIDENYKPKKSKFYKKLTWEIVGKIRKNHKPRISHKNKEWEKYGITNGHYYDIINNRYWKINGVDFE